MDAKQRAVVTELNSDERDREADLLSHGGFCKRGIGRRAGGIRCAATVATAAAASSAAASTSTSPAALKP
jgi:hypothetical protein